MSARQQRKTVHLVCNAHLDPVWLWEWEEGAAEALSTFRSAADFCDEFDGFVFNHNEVILYRWIEEYEPALFKRIQALVSKGKWHIMGGWHVQPDCNMPSGESFVRQALLGRRYFKEKFGVIPTTAINFDPFGHTRGLAQILAKSGYDSYLFCRPGQEDCELDSDYFTWEGYDGSQVMAARMPMYPSALGKARDKIEYYMSEFAERDCAVIPWGVGNHGGGPSRKDLRDLAKLIHKLQDIEIVHSTPEDFFKELKKRKVKLPVRKKDLNPWAVGCYTSQVRIKQKHRELENELYSTEKMMSAAWTAGKVDYPEKELTEAMYDLATCEFHDILPGSSIQPAEEAAVRLADHSLETLARLKARAFFALAEGQPAARNGTIPIMAYNPHPYPVAATIECEFQLPDQNWRSTFTDIVVTRNGRTIPSQVERELSGLPLDWRKRIVFNTTLPPSGMTRVDCSLRVIKKRPAPKLRVRNGKIRIKTDDLDVIINAKTGHMDRYRVKGRDMIVPGSCRPIVMKDNEDPWGMTVNSFRKKAGQFRLLSKKDAARFSGITASKAMDAVRIIEDGSVRTVIEVVFGYGDSFICQRYTVPKHGSEVGVEIRVFWQEKQKMLKLSVQTTDNNAGLRGQVAYGTDDLPSDGTEVVAQKWVAAVSERDRTALTCINDGSYGSDFSKGELRLSLLRSPAYSAHPISGRITLPQDRFSARIDQGERMFKFWLNGGEKAKRLAAIDREALAKNEKPMALSFFPSGAGKKAAKFVELSDSAVQVAAIKKADRGNALIIRLFEPTGRSRVTTVSIPALRMSRKVALSKFEIRTYRLDLRTKKWTEVDLMEKPLGKKGK